MIHCCSWSAVLAHTVQELFWYNSGAVGGGGNAGGEAGVLTASDHWPCPCILATYALTVLTRLHTQWMAFDACPLVSCLPHTAARLAALTPDAKLIFMVRVFAPVLRRVTPSY